MIGRQIWKNHLEHGWSQAPLVWLPPIHRDPFDRMIAADSLMNKMPILTPDGPYLEYGCRVIW